MEINLKKLEENVFKYLTGPQVRVDLAESESLIIKFAIFCLVFVVSVLMILSIIGAKKGLSNLMKLFSGELLDPTAEYQKNAASYRPFIASPVIVGPQGFGLVLFSNSKLAAARPNLLAKKAKFMGQLYKAKIQPTTSDEKWLFQMLRDDIYQPERIRQLPEGCSDGEELFMMDMEIHKEKISYSHEGLLYLLCA